MPGPARAIAALSTSAISTLGNVTGNVLGVVRAILVGLVVAVGAGAAGCSLEPPRAGVGGECRRDRDCETGLRCLSHECIRPGGGGTTDPPDSGRRDAGRDGGPPPRDAFVPADSGPADTGVSMDSGPPDTGPIDASPEEDAGLPIDADLPDVMLLLDAG